MLSFRHRLASTTSSRLLNKPITLFRMASTQQPKVEYDPKNVSLLADLPLFDFAIALAPLRVDVLARSLS
jgi:hypothetical protein